METEPTEVDLGTPDDDDPLAAVESDPSVADEVVAPNEPEQDELELPPGVERGSLGGFDPSAEQIEEQEAPLPEPAEGEFLTDPEDDPLGIGDVPVEEPPPIEPVEPEPIEVVEPEAIVVDEVPEEGGVPDDSVGTEPPAEVEPEPDPDPISPPPEAPEETATAVGGSDPEPEAEPEPEMTEEERKAEEKKAADRERKRKQREARKKAETGIRDYVPIQSAEKKTAEELEALQKEGRLWISHDTIAARTGEQVLRKTYRSLMAPDGSGSFVLAAVPEKLWKPQPVEGEPMDQIAIKIGKTG